jgi:hypothetical protein
MQSLLLLSSRHWVCALSASVPGRVSEFGDAHSKRLRQPTKLRAHVIPRCAPILALSLLSLFTIDGIAKPLK